MNRLHLAAAPPVEQVLIQPKAAGARYATDPAMRQAVRAVVAALHRLPATTASGIRSPLEAGGRSLISADGRAALVTFNVTGTQRRGHGGRPGATGGREIQAAVRAC